MRKFAKCPYWLSRRVYRLRDLLKKGLGSFTLPGLLKVNVVNVPAKKKRTGIDPFTKQERVFAAKPASVKIKTRALKKLKDAAA